MSNLSYDLINLTEKSLQEKINENGRIDLMNVNGLNGGTPLFLQDKNIVVDKTNYSNCRPNIFNNSDLEKLFLSARNMWNMFNIY